jgi:DNA-binding XRE family transcriptional regulator
MPLSWCRPPAQNSSANHQEITNQRGMEQKPSFGSYNRLSAVMAHTTRYAFKGQARLARDIGVSRSTIFRLIAGETRPSLDLALRITDRLEEELGRHIDPRDLLSLTGSYPTPSVCALCGCRGCLPEQAYDNDDRRHPLYQDLQPGQWSFLFGTQIHTVGPPDSS